MINLESIDTEDTNKRLIDAELKIWKKVEDMAYAVGKHPDEVYADLIIQFSEFIEKKYPTEEYPNEILATEHKESKSIKIKKTTQNELIIEQQNGVIEPKSRT
jgi:hypothetical protein